MTSPSLAEQLDLFFSLLSKKLTGYEERVSQKEMAHEILKAYLHDKIALIEAGTGTGKSLAYLLPAVLNAVFRKETTVISTHTIALQEQLIDKDIPFLQKMLGLEFKAVLVKGSHNYACLSKYEELEEKAPELQTWIKKTEEGSRSSLPFSLPSSTWDKLAVDRDRCTASKCSFFKPCFFFKARRKLEEAKILVVNHHLLLTDLNKELSILPKFDRLILDEAHHLEEVALDLLSHRVDRTGLVKMLTQKIEIAPDCSSSLRVRLEIDLAAERRVCVLEVDEAFQKLEKELPPLSFSYRVRNPFSEATRACFAAVSTKLGQIAASLTNASKQTENEHFSQTLFSYAAKLREKQDHLTSFFTPDKTTICWVEKSITNIALIETDLNVSSYLNKLIFDKFPTVSLCSATLAAGREFSFIKQALGIEKKETLEKVFDSPFDFKNSAVFAVPKDIPLPHEPTFLKAAAEMVLKAIESSRGGAFVLFTSYDALHSCYNLLQDRLSILRQGEFPRSLLLEKFKAHKGSILFGTDSFWEGVDVPGDALRLVILFKLPFKVPDDPLVEAKSEQLKSAGKEPFMEYLVPEAALKFKQGFGRLIRRHTDRGYVLCLDKRVMTKPYGKVFLKGLPPCPVVYEEGAVIFDKMERFYGA